MLGADLIQGLMEGCGIFFRKGRLRRFLEFLDEHFLGSLPGNVAADAIHCDSVCDAVQPRSQRTGVFQPPNATKRFDPHFLEHVGRAFLVARYLGRVIEQRPLHHCDEVLEGAGFAGLATKREPFVPCSIVPIHSLLMSKWKRWWFNLSGLNWFELDGRLLGKLSPC